MLETSLQETYEAKRNEFLGELQKKEEEMRQMFVMRVKEKEGELKEAEKDVSRTQGVRKEKGNEGPILGGCWTATNWPSLPFFALPHR